VKSLAAALRPRILDRYIVQEVLPPTGLGLLLFTFVMLLQQITLVAGILISRGADLTTTLRLFFNLLPSIFALTIPMAFLLGVLLAFGRLASESEIVAMRASGISPGQMLRPVLLLSGAAGLLTFYIMTVALPHANTTYREVFYTLVIGNAKSQIKPRVFEDFLPQMVLYVSDIAPDSGEWKNVFVSDIRTPSKPKIILARSGRLIVSDRDKSVMLHLETGYVHAYDRLNPREYYKEYFKSGDFYLPFDQLFPKVPLMKGDREMTLTELRERIVHFDAQKKTLDAAMYRVELHKKFSIPFACVVFGLIGLGLSLGSRKEARSAAFALSIVVISVYYVILRLGEQAGDTGLLSPFLGMWGANLVVGAAGIGLIILSQREAAFDPMNPLQFASSWIPAVKRRARPRPPSSGPVRAGIVIRIPRPQGRRPSLVPNILDRYIARQFVTFAFLILVGFWAIFFLFHFMDLFDEVRKNHVKGSVVLHFYTFYAPEIVHLIAPLAMLVGTLTTFGILSRRNEITAMKAGGISVYRAAVPVLVVGILGTLVMFVMGEFLLPHTNKVASRDLNEIKGRPPQSTNYLERRWILGSDGRIYNYDYMSRGGALRTGTATASAETQVSLFGLSVFDVDETWNLKERLYAKRARWTGGGYELERGWRWSFQGAGPAQFREFGVVRTREVEPPNYFIHEEPPTDAMRFLELRSHIASMEALNVDVARLKVQLHRKLAFPLVCLIMTLIGIRFSFTVGQRGALYGIGLSIFIGILYWMCLNLFEAMGNYAWLPPLVAAWAPNFLFASGGAYMMLTLET
jgi:LPS export ABC transporter permease LptG/LPS export ABC transporter permease LptF